MTTEHLTLADLIIELRAQLLEATQSGNALQLNRLGYVFAVIEESALARKDVEVYEIAMHLFEAVRDAIAEETWKSTIPTVEQIKEAFDRSR